MTWRATPESSCGGLSVFSGVLAFSGESSLSARSGSGHTRKRRESSGRVVYAVTPQLSGREYFGEHCKSTRPNKNRNQFILLSDESVNDYFQCR